MTKKILLTLLSIVFIVSSLLIKFVYEDYFIQKDIEIAQFLSGFMFAVGVGILLRIYLIQRRIDSMK